MIINMDIITNDTLDGSTNLVGQHEGSVWIDGVDPHYRFEEGCDGADEDGYLLRQMQKASYWAQTLMDDITATRTVDTVLHESWIAPRISPGYWFETGLGLIWLEHKIYEWSNVCVCRNSFSELVIGKVSIVDGAKIVHETSIRDIDNSGAVFAVLVIIYTLSGGDPVMHSLNRRVVWVSPASATEPTVDVVTKEVEDVTNKMSLLLSDPKGKDRLKNVELAFLTATTIMTDTFWKKLLAGSFLLLDLTLEDSLIHNVWEVLVHQLFEGANFSTIAEMFKSLRTSTTTKSIKQFMATFLSPLIGNNKLRIGEIELLSLNAADKVQGIDLASCAVETVNYMFQASSYMAEHGSLIGFLVPTPEIRNFMESYWDVIDRYDKIKMGQLDSDLASMHEEMSQLLDQANDLRKILTDPHGARQITQCSGMLAAKVRECYALMSEGDFKQMPFSMYIFGPTRCGKTTITKILEKHLSDALGVKITPGSKATISGASKFMTELRPTTKWVVIDDVASIKADFITDPPAETFLRLVNNVVTSLNQASIERKGEPAPRPHAVICTSNVYDMGAVTTQCDPRPILARIHMHVEMNVKPEWKTEQGLWDAKRFYDGYLKGDLGDSWHFTIRQMVPEDSPIYCKRSLRDPPIQIGGVNYAMVVVDDDQYGKLENIGIDLFLKVVRREVLNNAAVQQMAEQLNHASEFEHHFCGVCKNRREACTCVSAPITEEVQGAEHIQDDPGGHRVVVPIDPTSAREDPPAIVLPMPVEVMPAHLVVPNDVGKACAKMHDKYMRYATTKAVEKMDNVTVIAANMMGFNVDPVVFSNKVMLLCDAICKITATSRVFHYATWVLGDLSDSMLEGMISLTQEREINEHMYTVAITNFIRRLGIASVALCSPVSACVCLAAEPYNDEVASWVKEQYRRWRDYSGGRIEMHDDMSTSELQNRIDQRHCATSEHKSACLTCTTLGAAATYKLGPLVLRESVPFCLAMVSHIISCFNPAGLLYSTGTLAFAMYMLQVDLRKERQYALSSIMLQIRAARRAFRHYREANPVVSTAAAAGFTATGVWCRWTKVVNCQPASSVTRDAMYYEKWVNAHISPIVNQTGTELENSVVRNVVCLSYTEGGMTHRTRATAVQTSRLLVCQHFLPKKRTEMRLIRSPLSFAFGPILNSTIIIDYEPEVNEVPVGDTEVVLLRLKERVQFADITDRFSTTNVPHSALGSMIVRTDFGTPDIRKISGIQGAQIRTLATHRVTGAPYGQCTGLEFKGVHAFGDCGSAVLVGDKKSMVYGVFVGKTDRDAERGFAHCITKRVLDAAIKKLDGVYMPDLQLPDFNKHLLPDQTITKKSNLAHLPEGDLHFDYMGKVSNFNPDRDKIVKTPISQYLEECGYKNKWSTPVPGANPNVKSYDSSMKYIKKVLDTTKSPPTKDVMWARRDYFQPLVDRLKTQGEQIRPLTWDECANGVPGSIYIHSIDTSTAMGFPYGGKKNQYMTQDESGKWWFDKELMKDIQSADKQLRNLQIPAHAATITNKMEPRPTEKCARKIVSVNCVMTVLFKKYFCPIFEFILRQKDLSESAVGVNPYSKDWDTLYHRIKGRLLDGPFDGDVSNFDMCVASLMLNMVLLGNVDIAIVGGYSSDDIRAMHTLINWALSAPTIIDGELLVLYNRMISGMIGTSIIDGQVLSLIQRCCFHELYPKEDDFRKCVTLVTFGDDSIDNVKFGFGNFNKLALAEYCAKMGIVVTSGRKDGKMTKWDSTKEISFLKRKFRWSDDHGAYVGPLDIESICKPLHIGVQSKALNTDELLVENMTRALVEMSFHGEKEWRKLRDVLRNAPVKLFEKTPVADWEYGDYIHAWQVRYGEIPGKEGLSNISNVYGMKVIEVKPASSVRRIDDYKDELERTDETLQTGAPVIAEKRIDPETSVLSARTSETTELGEFLRRPIVLLEQPISPDTSVFTGGNIWRSYLSNPIIAEKLNHYRYIRGTAVLNIYYNVSPKFYGKFMLVIGWPSPGASANLGNMMYFGADYDDNVLASQSLCTYVSSDVDKAELRVPFVSRCEYIDMLNTTHGTADITGGWYHGETGYYYVRSMVPLRYAGDPPVGETGDIVVTMHLDDVELRGTTSQVVAVPASKTHPVHNIKDIADKIVMFGSVAMNVAESIGTLAAILGFSRENVGHEPSAFRNRNVGNTALCDVPTISAKLSVHKDQSLYVGYDPLGIVGVGDPESLVNIASHNSLICSFNWQQSDDPGTPIFSIRVTPMQAITSEVNGATLMTSMCYAAFPFNYWSGSLEFSFEVISSFLHRGRLLFVYDTYSNGSYNLI